MINDLDSTIKALLLRDLPANLLTQVNISFAPPDSQFPPPSVSLPAIDVFLYDIRENLELRTSEQLKSKQITPISVTLTQNPVHVRYSYIITAWSASTANPDQDEHRLLGAVMQVLLRYRSLPVEILQGSLAGIEPLPKAEAIQEINISNLGQFWQAMGGRPKPIVHYSLTVPMRAFNSIPDVPLVTDMRNAASNFAGNSSENIITQVAIAGKVSGSDTSNNPLAGSEIKISSNTVAGFVPQTTMAFNGFFYFAALPSGIYQIQAFPADAALYQPSAIADISVQRDAAGNLIMQQVNLILPKI